MTQPETEGFRHLYESYYRNVFAYCRRRVDSDSVDDLVADVFLTAWRRIADAPHDRDAELGWLLRIAYHHAGNHWRGSKRRQRLATRLESIGIQSEPLVQEQVVVREEVREVLSAAQNLRERDVEVLRLALWDDLTSEQIGIVLGITPNAAKQRIHRARTNLAREYQRNRSTTPAAQKGGEQ